MSHPPRSGGVAEFGNATASQSRSGPTVSGLRDTEEYRSLRRRHSWFVTLVGGVVFAAYLTYVALGAYARDWLSTPVAGALNVGFLLGLLLFALTAAVLVVAARHQRRQETMIAAVREAGEAQ